MIYIIQNFCLKPCILTVLLASGVEVFELLVAITGVHHFCNQKRKGLKVTLKITDPFFWISYYCI